MEQQLTLCRSCLSTGFLAGEVLSVHVSLGACNTLGLSLSQQLPAITHCPSSCLPGTQQAVQCISMAPYAAYHAHVIRGKTLMHGQGPGTCACWFGTWRARRWSAYYAYVFMETLEKRHAWPGSRDMRVLVWSVESAEVVQTLEGHKYQVRCLVLVTRCCTCMCQAQPAPSQHA